MARERLPRIRLVVIPDDAVLVVRGYEVDPAIVRADAVRFARRFDEWGRYGVSAFLAIDHDEVDVLCETRLERFATVIVFPRRDLEASGVEVVPMFRRPHVTLAHVDLDALVNSLRTCEHQQLANPHHSRAADDHD